MTEEERVTLQQAVAAISTWDEEDRRWWRHLLDVAPNEARLVAEAAVLLGARPVREGEA